MHTHRRSSTPVARLGRLARWVVLVLVGIVLISRAASAVSGSLAPRTRIDAGGAVPRSDPLGAVRFYVPDLAPLEDARQLATSRGQGEAASAIGLIASHENAVWLTNEIGHPDQIVNGTLDAAAAVHAVPVFVLYAIPHRDCGGYSRGGFATSSQYLGWVRDLLGGVHRRPAVFIVEPDALTQIGCLSRVAQEVRVATLHQTEQVLAGAGPQDEVYLDAGHQGEPVSKMAKLLLGSGVRLGRGFAVNVSNFYSTAGEESYGDGLSRIVERSYVIDTSRNGSGATSTDQWCNPRGRTLGTSATAHTGDPHVDAFLWIKVPGESDGSCGDGAPASGVVWPSYAESLVADGGIRT